MDSFGKAPGLINVRLRCLAPDHVGVGSIAKPARNGRIKAASETEEAIIGAFTGEELKVADIAVTSEQLGAVGISAGDQERRYAADVGSQPRGNQLGHEFLRGHQDLAAHVTAFFGRGKLVFKVDSGRSGL